MNMHWCSLKTNCNIEFSIPKLYENTPFHNLNVTHAVTKNHQSWKIKKTRWSTLKRWKLLNMHWCSLKADCTIKCFIPKLHENTPFHNFNVTDDVRNNYKVTITFMQNQWDRLINIEKLKVDEHALVLIKSRLYH